MSFIAELSWQDLQRLRAVVRKVHMRYYPTHHQTDREADRIIESLGAETRERILKKIVDSNLL